LIHRPFVPPCGFHTRPRYDGSHLQRPPSRVGHVRACRTSTPRELRCLRTGGLYSLCRGRAVSAVPPRFIHAATLSRAAAVATDREALVSSHASSSETAHRRTDPTYTQRTYGRTYRSNASTPRPRASADSFLSRASLGVTRFLVSSITALPSSHVEPLPAQMTSPFHTSHLLDDYFSSTCPFPRQPQSRLRHFPAVLHLSTQQPSSPLRKPLCFRPPPVRHSTQ
jgi:hypothetical protein